MKKQCSNCGVSKPFDDFHKKSSASDGRRSVCKPCRKDISASDYRNRKEKCLDWEKRYRNTEKGREVRRRASKKCYESHRQERLEKAAHMRMSEPWRPLLYGAKNRAKRIGVPFNLTLDDVRIPEFCPVLGVPITIGNGKVCSTSPSIDRIVPEKGYVKGNVVVVSHRANAIKNNATVEELRRVVEFYEKHM